MTNYTKTTEIKCNNLTIRVRDVVSIISEMRSLYKCKKNRSDFNLNVCKLSYILSHYSSAESRIAVSRCLAPLFFINRNNNDDIIILSINYYLTFYKC